MERKGQAAMEFLMTYGWAILAAVIAIGVLAYFGVFSPGKYVSGSAVVNPPFYANAWKVNTTGVQLEIKNNGGEDYNVIRVAVGSCTDTTAQLIVQSGMYAFNAVGCTPGSAGDTFKQDITITYRKPSSSIDMRTTGTISEKVAA